MALASLQSAIQYASWQLSAKRRWGEAIFLMLQDMFCYVQIDNVWQEVPLRAFDNDAERVLKVHGRVTAGQ
jgi:hypothetical protein